nr:MAG TPA: hypothetical protein [Caudoviricetes sp.]
MKDKSKTKRSLVKPLANILITRCTFGVVCIPPYLRFLKKKEPISSYHRVTPITITHSLN